MIPHLLLSSAIMDDCEDNNYDDDDDDDDNLDIYNDGNNDDVPNHNYLSEERILTGMVTGEGEYPIRNWGSDGNLLEGVKCITHDNGDD